jgi:hypothetical protein
MDRIRQIFIAATVALLILMVDSGGRAAAANEPPVAEAGLPRYAATDPVKLDGRGSHGPGNSGALTYAWTQVSGPPLVIKGADTATPTISGFVQTEAIQECQFQLIVRDGQQASSPDTVKVVIVPTFTGSTMTLENTAFDPLKPTVVFFGGGSTDGTGGGYLGAPLWCEKANIISLSHYVPDIAGSLPSGNYEPGHKYERPADMVIVYLSAVAPDYHQPIQTWGFSVGGLPALDVALRLNMTYADARFAVNHVILGDPSSWITGVEEYRRRVALLLANPVDREQCWVECYQAGNVGVCPSALNVVLPPHHELGLLWYRNSLTVGDATAFNHGVIAGAYWSVVGPGRNLQLASTPGVQTYKFQWVGSDTTGQMQFYDESNCPGRLPEPVALGALVNRSNVSGDIDSVVLSCDESENAVGYQLLFGSDPYRVMDFNVVSDTLTPPTGVLRELPSGETWWTIRVRDPSGSTIHADPVRLDLTSLPLMSVENARTGKRYALIAHALRDAKSGDVILLDPATYEENVDFGGKSLTLRSADPNNPVVVAGTIISGQAGSPTVTFSEPGNTGCVLAGLTIRGGTVGVSCRDAVPTIQNCVVESPEGIAIEFWSEYEPRLISCTLRGPMKEVADPRIVAYWKLDEASGMIAADSAGTNNGMLIGAPSWQPTGGKIGGALKFDGGMRFVMVPSVCDPSAGPFSAFLWVKGGAPGQVLLSQAGGTNWLRAAPDGSLMTELNAPLPSQVVITDGTWHRIGLVWDGTNRSLYVDNAEVAADTQTSLAPSTGGMYIGAASIPTPGTFWSGLIDDVRIYDRAVKP